MSKSSVAGLEAPADQASSPKRGTAVPPASSSPWPVLRPVVVVFAGLTVLTGVLYPLLVTGVAGLMAGAMSMAAGEYVSVQAQADTEAADVARERAELAASPAAELQELTALYVDRGLDARLAGQVASQLTAHDALGAHTRDELGLSAPQAARPVQAAFTSAASFAAGALLPLAVAVLAAGSALIPWVSATSLAFLAVLGGLAAWVGGAPAGRGAARVAFWGALAMGLTAAVGAMFGAVV